MINVLTDGILMTDRFVMSLKKLKAGESFVIESRYSTLEEDITSEVPVVSDDDLLVNGDNGLSTSVDSDLRLSLAEVNDIAALWDRTDLPRFVGLFKYADKSSNGFGKVSLTLSKVEDSSFNTSGEQVGKSLVYSLTVTAVSDIKANTVLSI